MSIDDDDEDDLTPGDKHRALIRAGWQATSSFQGALTKYLPPGEETGSLVQLKAYEQMNNPTPAPEYLN